MPGTVPTKGGNNALIWTLSIVLLGVIAFLYLGPNLFSLGIERGTLPAINGVINGITTALLFTGWGAIMRKQVELHWKLMLSAVCFSAAFLVLYVLQHSSFESAKYGGAVAAFYYFILITHIVLAALIVPLVLITLNRALSQRFDKHRKIAKVTLPLWLYVSITGVVVYLMMRPYY